MMKFVIDLFYYKSKKLNQKNESIYLFGLNKNQMTKKTTPRKGGV